jgi:hypothetical protein
MLLLALQYLKKIHIHSKKKKTVLFVTVYFIFEKKTSKKIKK